MTSSGTRTSSKKKRLMWTTSQSRPKQQLQMRTSQSRYGFALFLRYQSCMLTCRQSQFADVLTTQSCSSLRA